MPEPEPAPEVVDRQEVTQASHGDPHEADTSEADIHEADIHEADTYEASSYEAESYGTDTYGTDTYGTGTYGPDYVPNADGTGSFATTDAPQLFDDPDQPPPAKDWAWVEEWRAGGEPTPWGPGLVLAAFTAAIVGIAIYVISSGLIDRPVLAIVANVVIAAGLTPALWLARTLPVLRWVSLGGAAGAAVAWIAVIFFPVMVSA